MGHPTFSICNVLNVNFSDKMLITNSVYPIVKSIKRPTSSTNATFAATLPLITVVDGTTTACTATIERAQWVTSARERRIAH